MSLFDLTGKVAIVTGSTRGIGKAIVEQMAVQGARVTVSSRKAGPCEEVAGEINARFPGHAIAVPANISSKEDLQRLVDETRSAFGKIDILVCNAASNPYYGPQAEITDDAFRKILDNNIVSNHWLIQMVAPEMIERRDGAITIISSIGFYLPMKVGEQYILLLSLDHAGDTQLASGEFRKFVYNDQTKTGDPQHLMSDEVWEVGGPTVLPAYFTLAKQVMGAYGR